MPVCLYLTAITHHKIKIIYGNYGSCFRIIMGYAVPNIIKIVPQERSQAMGYLFHGMIR